MSAKMSELAPNDSFIINSQRKITDFEKQALTDLYRPLLTSDAYSLVLVLWELVQSTETMQSTHSHTILLNWLGIDLPSILEARGRLEALGLLKTFRKQVDNRSLFLYILQPPADPVTFFKDDTLSSLLLGAIGEAELNRLNRQLLKPIMNHDDFYDVSKKLSDYFELGQSVVEKAPVIDNLQSQIRDGSTSDSSLIINSNFDFSLLRKMLSTSFVNRESLDQNEHLIMVQQTIYGINESEMAQFIKSATNFDNNKIDVQDLKRRIANAYRTNQSQPVLNNDVQSNNSKVLKELSPEEQSVIEASLSLTPIDFIDSLKSKVGGFTTSAEKRIISDLVETGLLSVGVVNFLIYYYLVDQNHPTLNKNLTDAIANEWIKNKIKTPVDALKFVRERQQKKQQTKRSYGKGRPVIQKETLPKWAKAPVQTSEKAKVNPEMAKKVQAQLAKLKARGKEE